MFPCSNVKAKAELGTGNITFIKGGWPQANLSLSAGNAIAFDGETMSLTADEANNTTIVVTTERGELNIAPGQTEEINKCRDDWRTLVVFIFVLTFLFVLVAASRYALMRRKD